MSKADKIPNFLYNWRSAIVAFPAMALYCGILPLLKVFHIVEMSWFYTTAPIWFPFLAFWAGVGFIAFTTLVAEIGFWILPDKNYIDGQ